METVQRAKVREVFKHLELPDIEILNIPDDYEFMNEELISILIKRINDCLITIYEL